jgi:hypothetical protein
MRYQAHRRRYNMCKCKAIILQRAKEAIPDATNILLPIFSGFYIELIKVTIKNRKTKRENVPMTVSYCPFCGEQYAVWRRDRLIMKAQTILQPFASLIACGAKQIPPVEGRHFSGNLGLISYRQGRKMYKNGNGHLRDRGTLTLPGMIKTSNG